MINYHMLSAYPFFAQLTANSRRLVETQGLMQVFSRGAPVIRKGDPVGGMFFVVSGRLRIFMISPDGEEASLYSVERGESCLLSISAVFSEMNFPAWVEVETKEARVFCLPRAAFRTLHAEEAAVREFTVEQLSRRVFDLLAVVEERSLLSLEERLKSFLRRRANEHGEVDATHREIAVSMGTAREVVSRKLRSFAKAGWIQAHRGSITILEASALAAR